MPTPQEIENDILGADDAPELDLPGDADDHDGTPDPRVAASESEAGRKGWVPKHLYKGDPKKWVDAGTFLDRGERFNKNLQREVESLKSELASFKGTAAKFQKFHEETVERKNGEIKEAISALRVQRAQALSDGDAQLSVELEDRIDLLKDQQKEVKEIETAAPPPPDPKDNVVLQEWIEDGNPWFQDEPKMRDYALELGTQMRKAGDTRQGRVFLDSVTEQMQKDFPRYFRQKTGRQGASAVDNGDAGGGAGSARSHSARDLPSEDRALMREFIKQGVTTEEKFLKSYFSDAPRRHG